MGILYVFNNSLLVSYNICDQSSENHLSAKTKQQKDVTQGEISSHLVSYNPFIRFFFVILLTDKLTKTNRDENITSAVRRR